jgi:Zn-dependent protease
MLMIIHWLVSVALVATLHEAAHVAMALAHGLAVRRIGFSWIGPYVVRERSESGAVNAAVSLAAPALNLVLALLFWRIAPEFAHINLQLAIISSLPCFPASDGKTALLALRGKLKRSPAPHEPVIEPGAATLT